MLKPQQEIKQQSSKQMHIETAWHKNSITLVPMAKAEGKRPFFPWFWNSFLHSKTAFFI
jgi:hypothetical protein